MTTADRLAAIPGVTVVNRHFFNEFTLRLPCATAPVVDRLAEQRILAGVPVSRLHPGAHEDLLLVAATETVTEEDIDRLATGLRGGNSMTGWSARPWAPIPAPRPPLPTPRPATAACKIEEKLLFEAGCVRIVAAWICRSQPGCGSRLGGLERRAPIGLPGLSEPQVVVRHFTRLSQKNYAIDSGLYPLGSCTMKHNPRLNEKLARLAGFADLHPLQPAATVAGALELIDTLAHWLKTLTGLPAVALSPAAGAHGELCGIMTIRAALTARGDPRRRILVPESAHGTNPATAAACGYTIQSILNNPRGRVDTAALKAALGDDVAALMLTNPNTCGLFENEVLDIACRGAWPRGLSSIATERTSTRSSGGCGRPISVSTRCT